MGVWSLNIFVCPEGSKGILTDLTFCVLTMLQCSKIFKCLISLKISSSFISPAILLEVESNYLQFKTFQQPLLKVINIDYIKTFQSKFRCGIINIYFKQIKKKRNYFDLWYIFNSNMFKWFIWVFKEVPNVTTIITLNSATLSGVFWLTKLF